MANITLSVDDDVIRKVRKVAIDRNTTLSQMVRDFLATVAECDDAQREQAAKLLEASFSSLSRDMGQHRWTREDLHER